MFQSTEGRRTGEEVTFSPPSSRVYTRTCEPTSILPLYLRVESLWQVTAGENARVPRRKTGKFGEWCATVLGQVVTAPGVVRIPPGRRHCSRLYIHVYTAPCGCVYTFTLYRMSLLKLEQDSRMYFFYKLESDYFSEETWPDFPMYLATLFRNYY